MSSESGIETLVRFARLGSHAGAGASILPLLADALVAHTGAARVAVFELTERGEARFVTSPHLPEELVSLAVDPDMSGEELARELQDACHGRFAAVVSRPLVSGGGMFGSVIMFFDDQSAGQHLELAEGLIDLAAMALESEAKLHRLVRSQADLRASQEALARTEKLRALGQMAAGISHDLKNILNPLSLQLQLAQRRVARGQSAEAQASLNEMKQVLMRGVQSLERIRAFSRQSPEPRDIEVDLNQLLQEACEIARPRMAASARRLSQIKLELGEPAAVSGRAGDIVSALVNLIVNAIDAMPDGGTITLRSGYAERGSWAQVADDGPGMPPEVEQRVFEPFFTTKGEEGTGLGLAMVYACMQRHGGSITLETELGKGTTFTLWFPASRSFPPPAPDQT